MNFVQFLDVATYQITLGSNSSNKLDFIFLGGELFLIFNLRNLISTCTKGYLI
jgi:hypothetical protein